MQTNKRFTLILLLLIAINLTAFSQQLTPQEKAVFDDIAFSRIRVGEYEKIQKWVVPIRYKVYGDTSSYLVKEVDSVFSQLKRLTSLDIQKTVDEDEVNFKIVFGNDPEFFKEYTINKKPLTSPGTYKRRLNKQSELYQGESLINIKTYGTRTNIKYALKRHLLKILGFSKTTDKATNSLFYSGQNTKIKIDSFDSHIISTLYSPQIKPGMTKDEVDAILK